MQINLLPHREAARQRRKQTFKVTLLLSLLAGVVWVVLTYLWLQYQLGQQHARNRYLQAEIALLDTQIKEITGLEGEITSLRARQKAVEDLQVDRNLPVYLLTELARQMPDGVYVSQLHQQDQVIEIRGVAQSNERVSELLRNLAGNTPWFTKPELLEIVASAVSLSAKEQRKAVSFHLRFRLVRTIEATKAMGSEAAASEAGA